MKRNKNALIYAFGIAIHLQIQPQICHTLWSYLPLKLVYSFGSTILPSSSSVDRDQKIVQISQNMLAYQSAFIFILSSLKIPSVTDQLTLVLDICLDICYRYLGTLFIYSALGPWWFGNCLSIAVVGPLSDLQFARWSFFETI